MTCGAPPAPSGAEFSGGAWGASKSDSPSGSSSPPSPPAQAVPKANRAAAPIHLDVLVGARTSGGVEGGGEGSFLVMGPCPCVGLLQATTSACA